MLDAQDTSTILRLWGSCHFLILPACIWNPIGVHKSAGTRGGCWGLNVIEVASGEIIHRVPSLILHYILDHGYNPPDEFCKAVLNSRN
jgi:hypothetical protein